MKIYVKKVKNTKGEVKEWLWVDFYDKDGKRQRKTLKLLNTTANMKLAKTKIVPALLHKLENNEFLKNKMPTLDEFKTKSFEMNAFNRGLNTQNDYKISYDKHIGPHLGKMSLDKIKPSDIKLWQSQISKIVSPRRVRNVRAVLSGILKDAMADELIGKNPLSLVPTVKTEKVEISPFSLSEISTILEHAQGQNRNFFALAFLSGMRSGEMIGLKWSDIDFSKLEISIKRSRKMGVDGKTKTQSSKRTIDILDTLLPYLESQFELTGSQNSYVFLNDKNEPFYDIKRIRDRSWKNTLTACELDYRPIYHTRHSFATVMLENGEDILWLSNMLGHTDSSMTLSKYAHYVKQKNKKRGEFLKVELAPNDTEFDTEKDKAS